MRAASLSEAWMSKPAFYSHLTSWGERLTVLALAGAATIATFTASSATIVPKRPDPTVVYLWHPLPYFLNHGNPFNLSAPAGASWRMGPKLDYPSGLPANSRQTGWVDVRCDVSSTGWPRACSAVQHEGAGAFIALALSYVRHGRYSPAMNVGEAIAEKAHVFHVAFDAYSDKVLTRFDGPELAYPPQMAALGREGWADVQCDVDADGNLSRCAPVGSSDAAFIRPALAYIKRGTYVPSADDEGGVIHLRHRFHVRFSLGN